MTENFDDRLDQVERAIRVITTIENNPELQAAVFSHLFGTAPRLRGAGAGEASLSDGTEDDAPAPDSDAGNAHAKARAAGRGAKRTAKVAVSQDKNLDPAPAGIVSWRDFVAEKKPVTHPERNTVAVYWLKELAGIEHATVNQVYTLYLDANWKPAADPRNSLQVAASKNGTLDTVDTQDIKLTPRGVGMVKNDLPRPEKK